MGCGLFTRSFLMVLGRRNQGHPSSIQPSCVRLIPSFQIVGLA